VHAGGKLQQRDALVACDPIGLGRYAQQDRVRVKPGETYRQSQASSNKQQATSNKHLTIVTYGII